MNSLFHNLPIELMNHILSFRPTHPTAKIIEPMIKINNQFHLDHDNYSWGKDDKGKNVLCKLFYNDDTLYRYYKMSVINDIVRRHPLFFDKYSDDFDSYYKQWLCIRRIHRKSHL